MAYSITGRVTFRDFAITQNSAVFLVNNNDSELLRCRLDYRADNL